MITDIYTVMKIVQHFRDLEVYQGAMEIVMSVSDLTKKFPADEKYVWSDQIRPCSRSVCANLAEAWRKRRYLAAFVSKLNDAETEAAETQVHLEIAFRHEYIDGETFEQDDDVCDKIISQIVKMIDRADLWIIKPKPQRRIRR